MKYLIFLLFLLLLMPLAAASHNNDSGCSLTNLGSCLTKKLYDFLLNILNAPLLPLLAGIKKLLSAEVKLSLFKHLWSIIRYILSFFYLFLFVYAGSVFLTANANPIKRSHAKDMLKNVIIMIVLIQSSYYLYSLILNLSSILNSTILSMIDRHFFLLTLDNITNIGLQFYFSFFYGITLFFTLIMLVLRYIIISLGVVLVPIALFCYFIPPLKGYGKFILNMLGLFIFVAFFDLLIILACSMIVEISLFSHYKILVMIACFLLVNYTLWLAFKFALKRSTNVSLKDDLQKAVKFIALAV